MRAPRDHPSDIFTHQNGQEIVLRSLRDGRNEQASRVWLDQFQAVSEELCLVVDMLHNLRTAYQIIELFLNSKNLMSYQPYSVACLFGEHLFKSCVQVLQPRLELGRILIEMLFSQLHTSVRWVYPSDRAYPQACQTLAQYPRTASNVQSSHIPQDFILSFDLLIRSSNSRLLK